MTLRTKLIACFLGTLMAMIAFLAGAAAVTRDSSRRAAPSVPASRQTSRPTGSSSAKPTQNAQVNRDLALIASMPAVKAKVSRTFPLISKANSSQPDLFARAFATELLAQNYANDRQDLLAWVQAESASSTEPLVVGLVPSNLRPKLAVYSLSESSDGSPVPIPSDRDWLKLRAEHASAIVHIQKVIEPVQWSEALDAGQLSDPSITECAVDAEVITSWHRGNRTLTQGKSIALTMNLEGPPSRAGYGFVTSPLYSEVDG